MSRLRISVTPASSPASARWLALALFAATLLAYLPSLSGGFLWDDDGHVTKPQLRSLDGLVRIWTEPAATQQYYPLLHSAFWLEHKLWGDAPLGYRLVNIFLHATSACLFAALLRRFAVPGAWLAAFLFALHPVCVESVAWITEQKNTLSLVCYLAAALAYLRFDTSRRPSSYAIATALFIAAVLSKTVTATLPAAILVILFWKNHRLNWRRDILPLSLWVALGLCAGLMTIWTERTLIGAEGESFSLSLAGRFLVAGRVIWFYLGKLVWPADLVFIYPRWTIDAARLSQWLFPLAALALTAALAMRKNLRSPLTAWLLFIGTLFPALGFFNVYPFLFSYVADHFQYHASLAIFAAVATSLTRVSAGLPRPAFYGATLGLLLSLGILSSRQSAQYCSSQSLYESTLEKNADCWLAHNNLAQILSEEGRPDLALDHLHRALALHAGFHEAENNLGFALNKLGRPHEAIIHLKRALALRPRYTQAHNNLGLAYAALKDFPQAITSFREAIRINPGFSVAHFNLGLALAQSGEPAKAIPEFTRAVALDPAYADAERNWAIGLMLTGKFTEAIPHFERAIALAPDSAENRHNYGRALANNGRLSEAVQRYREALEIDPENAGLHRDLALALRQLGQLEAAASHYQEAQRLRGSVPY